MKKFNKADLSNAPEDFPITKLTVIHLYDTPSLSGVYTLREVMKIWNKTERQVRYACTDNKLKYRISVEGGLYLIDRCSVVKIWGEPSYDLVQLCFEGQGFATGDFQRD